MKVNLPSVEDFNIQDVIIAGDECVLITPNKKQDLVWTEDNKFFRSSIWRKQDMHPVSLGFRKFTNLHEQPHFESIGEYDDLEFVRKMDGTLAILSFWKGEIIFRTRNRADVTTLKNGAELEFLKQKYPKVFALKDPTHSLLFEWTTPSNRIVLEETKEPTLWLIGTVRHSDYYYFEQRELDQIARELDVPRPERYSVNKETLYQLLEEKNELIEGVVIYANKGQFLKKVKTSRYLHLHKVFTGIKTFSNMLNFWVSSGKPDMETFKLYIKQNYHSVLLLSWKPLLEELEHKYNAVNDKIKSVDRYVLSLKEINLDRKEMAEMIKSEFSSVWQKIAFGLLSNKRNFKIEDLMSEM